MGCGSSRNRVAPSTHNEGERRSNRAAGTGMTNQSNIHQEESSRSKEDTPTDERLPLRDHESVRSSRLSQNSNSGKTTSGQESSRPKEPTPTDMTDERLPLVGDHESGHSPPRSRLSQHSQNSRGKTTPVELIVLPSDPPAPSRLTRERVVGQLNRIARSLSPSDYKHTLKSLNDIYRKVVQNAKDKRYYQIKLTDETFSNTVCRHPACQELMKISGWVVKNDHVRLKDDSHVHIVSQLLERRASEKFPLAQATHQVSLARHFSNEVETDSSDDDDVDASTSTMYVLSKQVSNKACLAIFSGLGFRLVDILNQYDASVVKNMYLHGRVPLISVAYITRQIGIARILVREYSVDPNTLDADGDPCFIGLFRMCDPSDVCQNLIIDFVKEFKLNIGLRDGFGSFIHHVVLHQLFKVLKYLVDNCDVDINQAITISPFKGGTVLHLAYSLNEWALQNI